MSNSRSRQHCLTGIRWTARILGTALAAFVLFLVVGHAFSEEGLPNPFTQPLGVAFELLGLFAAWLGVIIAWKWEGVGGLLAISGMMIFHIVERSLLLAWTFELFDLVGVLFLVCWCASRMHRKETQK